MRHNFSLDQTVTAACRHYGQRLTGYRPVGLLLALLALLFVCPGGLQGATPERPHHPVLFVHGSGLTAALWKDMIAAMEANGVPPAYLRAVDLLPRDGSNPRAAQRYIMSAVSELLATARIHALAAGMEVPRKVDIVAHSMGAVSSRWYALKLEPERVRVWIGIAPANHGTNALCGFSGQGNRELCPAFARDPGASRVQFELNGGALRQRDETPYGLGADPAGRPTIAPDRSRAIAYFTVRIDPDRWIIPADSAVLEGAGGLHFRADDQWFRESSSGNYLMGDAVDHDALPTDPRIIEWVSGILAAADTQITR